MEHDNEVNTAALSHYQLRGRMRAMIEDTAERFSELNDREMIIKAIADEVAEMLECEHRHKFTTSSNSRKRARTPREDGRAAT